MSSKTWFLPPDFTFLPDGAIALGRVIPSPRQPTTAVASLGPNSENPTIPLPAIRTLVEKNRAFSAEKTRSFGFELFTKFLDLASASGKADTSWSRSKSFGAVDHEVRTLDGGAFAPEALRAVARLEEVKRHMEGGRFGRRCAYVITGLRVAVGSFTVTDERGTQVSGSVGGSGPAAAGVPVEVGGGLSGGREDRSSRSYDTAPGIVFAYRLHVIRPKRGDDAEGEVFSDRTAFMTGDAEEDEEAEEMEVVEVDVETVRSDLDIDPDAFGDEQKLEEGDEESYVVMN